MNTSAISRLSIDSDVGNEEELRLRVTLSPLSKDDHVGPPSVKSGLNHPKAIFLMVLWYFFSAFNLFANKYILSYEKGDPALLAMSQMLMCSTLGFIQLRYSCGLFSHRHSSIVNPWTSIHRSKFLQRPMLVLGSLRFTTLVLGLTSLNYVAVSFTETVKSSAPIFTVIIASIFMGEKTGLYVNLSLMPIMVGLALCSATELSFNMEGFIAALLTNLSECLQNVYSKMLLSSERHKYGPAELQFYTSVASFVIQIMASFFLVDWAKLEQHSTLHLVGSMLLNGAFFHFQSITEYGLLEHITPVTHSVANTVKRALLIWLSILVFGNTVSLYSGIGTAAVIGGVLLYNKARQMDARRIQQRLLLDPHPQKIAL